MKKILTLSLFVAATITSHAEELQFQAGALIIPMDRETQNLENDGIFLAYGLIFQLLGQGYTVHAAINPDKENQSQDYPDVEFPLSDTASQIVSVFNGSDYMPEKSAGESDDTVLNNLRTLYKDRYNEEASLIYRGGPFVIDADNATAIKAFLDDNPEYASVVIHQFKDSQKFDIGVTYDESPKKVALLYSENAGTNYTEDVLECYMELAGIAPDYYDILSQDDLVAGQLVVGTYYILWMPHWELKDQADAAKASQVIDRIEEFLDAGGNVLATCRAVDSLSAEADLMASTDLAVNENEADLQPADAQYDHHDIPFAQIGNYQFEVDPNDMFNFHPFQSGDATLASGHSASTSKWLSNAQVIAYKYDPDVNMGNPSGATSEQKWAYYAVREKDDDDNKGNIHYLAGHQYASCKPTIQPGLIYSFSTTMSDCKKGGGSKQNFWSQSDPCIRITLHYSTGDKSISLELCEGDVRTFVPDETTPVGSYTAMTIGNEFMLWAEDPSENTDRFGVNYGSGCSGGGGAKGTDHLGSVYLQSLTDSNNIIIQNITVEWSCDGFSGGVTGGGCGTTYQFEQFDIRVLDKENGKDNCGRSSCDQCTNVYKDGKSCEADGAITFVPKPKTGGDLTFDGGQFSNTDGSPVEGNVGGLRYIYNTLFNKIQNPIATAEFARSGPVTKKLTLSDNGTSTEKTYVYFGTFEYPGNAGHFRAYEATGTGTDLNVVWDAQDNVPAYLERSLFTFIDGAKVAISASNAKTILDYIQDASLTEADVTEHIQSFLGKYRFKRMGGIERSTAAIIPPNNRTNPSRKTVAYVGSTYGVLEVIDLSNGSELTGYVPAAILPQLEFTGTEDVNRPKVDSSPTVLDAYLLTGNGTERAWKTILLVGHGTSAGGVSCLDITDPEDIKLMWEKFSTITPDPDNPPAGAAYYGNVHRVSVARYKKDAKDPITNEDVKTLGYAAVVASNLVDGSGLSISAYDLNTGDLLDWTTNPIVVNYPSPVEYINDIPSSPAIWDSDNDSFDDSILVGDMSGKIWNVDVSTGKTTEITDTLPGTLPNTEARPIGATPSVGKFDGQAVIAFGTGGTNWSNATNNIVRVVSLADNSTVLEIDIGTKRIFSPIVIAGNRLFFTAVDGTLGSADPTLDIPEDDDETELWAVYYTETESGGKNLVTDKKVIDKTESNLYVNQGQTYTGGYEGQLRRHGTQSDQERLELFEFMLWHDVNNKVPEVVEPVSVEQ